MENHSIVHIRRHNDAERYLARVLCIGHSCDLALLTVEDESFWEVSPPPLELAPLPRLYEDVMVRCRLDICAHVSNNIHLCDSTSCGDIHDCMVGNSC